MPEKRTCRICEVADENVKVLKTGTPVHPQCMEEAALGKLAEEIGWMDEP